MSDIETKATTFRERLKQFFKAHTQPLDHPADVLYYEQHGRWPEGPTIVPEEFMDLKDDEGEALPPIVTPADWLRKQ